MRAQVESASGQTKAVLYLKVSSVEPQAQVSVANGVPALVLLNVLGGHAGEANEGAVDTDKALAACEVESEDGGDGGVALWLKGEAATTTRRYVLLTKRLEWYGSVGRRARTRSDEEGGEKEGSASEHTV